MGRIAFLSMDDLTGYFSDDAMAHAPLAARGWRVEEVSWRAAADWSAFDAVIIRTTWDYPRDPEAFVAVLAEISGATRLINDLPLVRWNVSKGYLAELAERGIPIPPTVWGHDFARAELPALFEALGSDELVVKPAVGAGGDRTLRLRRGEPDEAARTALAGRDFLAQPFLPAVVGEGEFSLFFFGGELAHTVLKVPRAAEFRVQEEHGGTLRLVRPEPAMVRLGRRVLDALPGTPLYARVDLVRDPDDEFRLMEIELIEPSLYFRMDPQAPDRFAAALDAALRSR